MNPAKALPTLSRLNLLTASHDALSSRSAWRLCGVTGVVVFVFHLATAISHGGPVAVPDVVVYLSYAQWLNGGVLPTDPAFFPGYGLLLAGFGGLSGATLHTAAGIVNGLFASMIVVDIHVCIYLCLGIII